MTWAATTWAWLFVPLLLLAWLVWRADREHTQHLKQIFRGEILQRVLPQSVRVRRTMARVLGGLGLCLLVIAAMGPRFGKQLVKLEARGVDLIIAIDLSRSMDATDVNPSRLERTRREVLDLLDIAEGDRIGLVTFAGGAFPQMPLSLDRAAVRTILQELDTHVFQAQGSSLGRAIDTAREMFGAPIANQGRAVLMITDGETHQPSQALEAAQRAARDGIAVYGLIVGTKSVPIPLGDGSFVVDPATGEPVSTRPSESVLRDIAMITGGAVVRSVPSATDVETLYRDEIRAHALATVSQTYQRERWQSAFQWPLAAGLLSLLASAWLGDGRRAAVVLACLLISTTGLAATPAEADLAYRSGEFDRAAEIFTELSTEDPFNVDLLQRLAAARYRAGDYEGASRAYDRLVATDQSADNLFNSGNAHFQAGRLEKARERYDQVLAADPTHDGASRNQSLLAKEIKTRRQEQARREQAAQDEPPTEPDTQPADGGGGEQQSQGATPTQSPATEPPQDSPSSTPSSPSTPPNGADAPDGQAEGGDGQARDTPPNSDGTRSGEDDGRDGVGLAGEPLGVSEGDPQGKPTGPVIPQKHTLTAEEASRTLDSVEEGRPRVYIPGERSPKPW